MPSVERVVYLHIALRGVGIVPEGSTIQPDLEALRLAGLRAGKKHGKKAKGKSQYLAPHESFSHFDYPWILVTGLKSKYSIP
jgi:hypothetical protein